MISAAAAPAASSMIVPMVASAIVHAAAFGVFYGSGDRANDQAEPMRNLIRSVSVDVPPLTKAEPPPRVLEPVVEAPKPDLRPEVAKKAKPVRRRTRKDARRVDKQTKPAAPVKPRTPTPAAPTIAVGPGSVEVAPQPQTDPETVRADAPQHTDAAANYDLSGYGDGVHGALLAHRQYPDEAQDRELQGEVLVVLTLDRSGELAAAPGIARSSGHECLDQEALRMVRAAAPFANLPDDYPVGVAEFTVPVRFELQDEEF